MDKPIVLEKPAVRFDLAAHYAFIGDRSQDAADRFLLNAESTFELLARSPGIGELYELDDPRFQGLRCFRVKKFRNYLVFSFPIENGIDVVRVLHASRDIRVAMQEEME